jgi:nitrate/nitrite transporter NarK
MRASLGPAVRRWNPRIVIVGSALIALAVAFFVFLLSTASKSSNPAELMRTVGTVSGIAGAMIAAGSIGRKVP